VYFGQCVQEKLFFLHLRLLLRRHSKQDGGNDRLKKLKNVGSGHVFESATEYALEDGEPKKSKATMSLHVRKHLLGEFQSSESYVLFNTNLLSTGVDLPCCDGVVLLSPSEKNRTVLQHWGRSLRVESHNVDTKTGTLALVVEDPMVPTELVEERQRRLGIEGLEVLRDGNGLDADKFRHVLRTAEAAASESNKVLGDVFNMATQWRKQAKGVSSHLGVRVFSSDVQHYEVDLGSVLSQWCHNATNPRFKECFRAEYESRLTKLTNMLEAVEDAVL
jgi:superfamily II DNA or RNA helicase